LSICAVNVVSIRHMSHSNTQTVVGATLPCHRTAHMQIGVLASRPLTLEIVVVGFCRVRCGTHIAVASGYRFATKVIIYGLALEAIAMKIWRLVPKDLALRTRMACAPGSLIAAACEIRGVAISVYTQDVGSFRLQLPAIRTSLVVARSLVHATSVVVVSASARATLALRIPIVLYVHKACVADQILAS
jgi:hypothetical protein